jgi:serine/threonine protein kinase
MINADCTIKLADFGLARVMTGNPWSKQLAITDYVTTRWYRAPEVLAGWSCYGYSVDIWALGCILVELINRSPIFAGNDSLRQLEKIVAILGKPHQSFINKCLKYSYR